MKNRNEFSVAVATLILEMNEAGESPLLDWLKRSDEEQKRLFDRGKSKCDEKKKISRHQRGMAVDIYFMSEDKTHLVDPIKGYDHWRRRWEELGGKPIIGWDKGHYEG